MSLIVGSLSLTQMELITLDAALNDLRWSALDSRNAAERAGSADGVDGASLRMRDADELLTRVRALLYR